jgi:hypothetical protein
MMQVNHRYYQDLTPSKVDALIEAARQQQLRAEHLPGFNIRHTWSETVEADVT